MKTKYPNNMEVKTDLKKGTLEYDTSVCRSVSIHFLISTDSFSAVFGISVS